MKCLVTGAAGFIGSHLSERLVRDGHTVKRLNLAAVESERFIRTVADTQPGMLAYWDKGLRCRFANLWYAIESSMASDTRASCMPRTESRWNCCSSCRSRIL